MSASISPVRTPFRLLPQFKERVWGRTDLQGWFPVPSGKIIGEVWFTASDNATSYGPSLGEVLSLHPEILGDAFDPANPALCPLLIKFLFTSAPLSVQVHPDDTYALRHHQSLGKTEAWYILNSSPGASITLGFREAISQAQLQEAALSGAIERLLSSKPVHTGEFVFVPAGTVHAIGAGLTICEIQQNSDITYRLYDYGRPRELHLEHAAQVSDLGPYTETTSPVEINEWRRHLGDSSYFSVDYLHPEASQTLEIASHPHYVLLIAMSGSGSIGGQPFERGQTWFIPANADAVSLRSTNAEWLAAYPGQRKQIRISSH